jgi:hypothetical protein
MCSEFSSCERQGDATNWSRSNMSGREREERWA